MDSARAQIVVVTLADASSAEKWRELDSVDDVVTIDQFAPSGYRAGSRALGLGVDSLRVALRAVRQRRRVIYLATNPWIGVLLQLLTRRPVAVTGLYTTPGSRYWEIFRRVLGRATLVTLSDVEAQNWRDAGGRAVSVLYGNDFPYMTRTSPREDDRFRIFVGGSSDRDFATIERLENEMLESNEPVDLVVATGGPARVTSTPNGSVTYLGPLNQKAFGDSMAACDVTFLPLLRRERAAGHMILVGSLQVGTPVVFTGGGGMNGYADGTYVRELSVETGPLKALIAVKAALPTRDSTHQYWRANFGRLDYISRVESAVLDNLSSLR